MPMDESPFKPPKHDPRDQTLDTASPVSMPGISFVDATPGNPQPSTIPGTAFSTGQIVAKRFRIERFIAKGGMGEVYEALDIELKQKVALKTVSSSLLSDAKALERFRQEIVVAKRVTHPNVCRTYDLFRQEAAKEGEADVLLVSMELLTGETLDQFLKAKGKLSTAEALPLIQQMVAGLAAAHQSEIVHRDFKPGNVMLIPPPSGAGTARVVVGDFGLAHSLDANEFALTRTGEMLGTPAYMAPEQVTGKEITKATDIYSLGVVIFEMATGRLPFEGKNWRDVAFKRLEGRVPIAKSLQPDLDDVWSTTIEKCMQIAPADRFAAVTEVERALVGEIKPVIVVDAERQRRKRQLFAALGLVAVAVIGVAIGVAFPNLLPWRRPPTVTVLGFRNANGDESLNPWGDQFNRSIRSQLESKPIAYKSLASMGNPWVPPPPNKMPTEPESKLLKTLNEAGCRYIVYGEYRVEGLLGSRKISLDIDVYDSQNGTVENVHEDLMESNRESAAESAGVKIRKILDVPATESILPATSNDLQAALGSGERKMDNFDFDGARQDFQKAVDLDPDNAQARSALAEAYWNLGYEVKASKEASTAVAKAGQLPSDQRIRIDLRQKEYSKQWDDAADIYRSLWKNQSDVFYALELARCQMEGNHLKESLATLQLVKDRSTAPNIQAMANLRIADVQTRLANNQDRLNAAQQAAKEAQAFNSPYLIVNAGIEQCLALTVVGRINEASPICSETVQQSQKLNIPSVIAHAKTAQANLFASHAQYSEAERLYEDARQLTHAAGDLHNEAGAIFNLGYVQYQQGNFPAARGQWEKSLQVSRQRGGVNSDLLRAQEAIANVIGDMGDVKSQIAGLEAVVKEAEPVGDKTRLASALGNLCAAQIPSGEVLTAMPNCEKALQLRSEMFDRSALARSYSDMGDYLLASANLDEAEKNYKQALVIQIAIQETSTVRTSRRSLAEISMERGNYPQAKEELLSVLQEFLHAKDTDNEAVTRADLAEVYLKTGHPEEAKEQIKMALEHSQVSGDPTIQAQVAIQEGKLEGKYGQSSEAASDLSKIEKNMMAKGFAALALDAKLARLETLTGPERKKELKSFADETRKSGYLLLARKATEAAGT
jgi:eukaryotic-like serine/threonine-protein kinase